MIIKPGLQEATPKDHVNDGAYRIDGGVVESGEQGQLALRIALLLVRVQRSVDLMAQCYAL